MKKVYTANDPVAANLLKELLDNAGIDATIEGERLHPLLGAMPVVYPTVSVREEDYDAALKVVAEYERSRVEPDTSEPWTCPKCGEQIEGHFDECWKCDAPVADEETQGRGGAGPSTKASWKTTLALTLAGMAVAAVVGLVWMSASRKRAEQFCRDGVSAFHTGNAGVAIEYLGKAIELAPSWSVPYLWRGYVYGRERQYEDAVSDYNRAVTLTPKDDQALVNRAWIFREMGRVNEALDDYSRALALKQDSAFALAQRGLLQWELGHMAEASADIQRALALDPELPAALGGRGLIHLDAGNRDAAVADFTKVLHRGLDAWALAERGVAYREAGRFSDAVTDFTAAIKANAEETYACAARGRAYRALGNEESARSDFATATRLTPRTPANYIARGFAWAGLGEFTKALEDCATARKARPWDRWVDYTEACVYCMRAGRYPATPAGQDGRKADAGLALRALEDACKKGLRTWAGLKDDEVLAILRDEPAFKTLLEGK
jgi:tetratricopeptide (TPR) repeat protein